jgi:hypothetical protein
MHGHHHPTSVATGRGNGDGHAAAAAGGSLAAADPAVRRQARSVLAALRPGDPRLGGTVRLVGRDGARTRLDFAFLLELGDWVCVFTRGGPACLAYRKDDLAQYEEQVAACHPRHPRRTC